MLVTLSGISMLVSEVPINAKSPRVVTLFGMVYDGVVFLRGYNMSVVTSLSNNTPSSLEYWGFSVEIEILVNVLQE